MSDELSMEIIENLSEELGQKELRIMELEKALQVEKNNHRHTGRKVGFYRDAMGDRLEWGDEGAAWEWEDGMFSSCKFDIEDELRLELFLECMNGRKTTVKEFMEETDDSNDEAIKKGQLEPMTMNDIQKMIIYGDVIDTNDDYGPCHTHRERSPLHSDTIIIVELD